MTDPHREITRRLEQAEVNLLHDDVTPEEIETAKLHILKSLALMVREFNRIKP